MKKIYDALHGFVRLEGAEAEVVMHPAFQRLNGVRQLAVAFLVYPGATHSRFEHSLGVMHVASLMAERLGLDGADRARVRMAALCHDLGHLPFSHTAELAVFGERSHEWMTEQILRTTGLAQLVGDVDGVVELACGKGDSVLGQIITDDVFGADRIDYLLRDGRSTGLPYGQVDYLQLIESLVEVDGRLGVSESGLEACESILLARYFMFNRVYHHPLIKALTFHLSKVIEYLVSEWNLLESVERYIGVADAEVIVEVKKIAQDPAHPLYEHALPIVNPACAYEMRTFEECELENLQSDEGYEREFFVEQNPQAHRKGMMDFLVKRKGGEIVRADQLSGITIPQMHHHFLYERKRC